MKNKERQADVEVYFEFNGSRKSFMKSGLYRPGHLVTENYITTGVHYYYDSEIIEPNGKAKGAITFITPEFYPHCLWEGKNILIIEGVRVVGVATILEVFNPILKKEDII